MKNIKLKIEVARCLCNFSNFLGRQITIVASEKTDKKNTYIIVAGPYTGQEDVLTYKGAVANIHCPDFKSLKETFRKLFGVNCFFSENRGGDRIEAGIADKKYAVEQLILPGYRILQVRRVG
ncbi:hypothetical protein [Pseudothermotoga sp.]|uniref:hypothetical protein n=1 Tax=Pseudothermotoga sp. TaxID=2033661 RepID=UPI0031F670F7